MASAIAPEANSVLSYQWQGFRCNYEKVPSPSDTPKRPARLRLHPIGVGLSRTFWTRVLTAGQKEGTPATVYNPDLLGCGDGDIPDRLTRPEEWAAQLWQLIETEIKRPVILVVQGALLPVGLELWAIADAKGKSDTIHAMILSGGGGGRGVPEGGGGGGEGGGRGGVGG
ncbi:MAG: hypothetical protein ACFCBU_03760, partial [Cyanophyceae cyanobacterium]